MDDAKLNDAAKEAAKEVVSKNPKLTEEIKVEAVKIAAKAFDSGYIETQLDRTVINKNGLSDDQVRALKAADMVRDELAHDKFTVGIGNSKSNDLPEKVVDDLVKAGRHAYDKATGVTR